MRLSLFRNILLTSILSLLLAACNQGEPINPEFDQSNKTFRVKMIFHDTQEQVIKAKVAAVGGEPEPNLLGWAGWNTNYEDFYCEIHTVKTKNE